MGEGALSIFSWGVHSFNILKYLSNSCSGPKLGLNSGIKLVKTETIPASVIKLLQLMMGTMFVPGRVKFSTYALYNSPMR